MYGVKPAFTTDWNRKMVYKFTRDAIKNMKRLDGRSILLTQLILKELINYDAKLLVCEKKIVGVWLYHDIMIA